MKKIITLSLIILAVILSGCNMPGYESPPDESDDSMATEISRILTGTPIEIQPTPQEEQPTTEPEEQTTEPQEDTVEPATATPLPEETEVPPTETLEPEEDTPTPTSTFTPTLAPTATLSDTDPAASLGSPDWVDGMDDGDNWPTGYNEYTSIDFEDGYLKLTADLDVDGWRLSWPFLDDFYLESTLKTDDCQGADHFGLMFRVPANANANKGYLFGITCDGKYSLRRWDGVNMYSPVSWTASNAINKGENVVNKIGVMAKGENLALYINGQKIKEVVDNVYLEGNFGIFVGSGGTTEDLTVWVDQIRYWENP